MPPVLGHVRGDRDWYRDTMREQLTLARDKELRPRLGPVYALADAVDAHRELDRRSTLGKIILAAGS